MADPVFEPLRSVTSRIAVMPQEDIDTDQILPARFMTTTGRGNLADALFRDWAGTGEGSGFPFDQADPGGRRVLIAGRNFGVGSSREHAVWALVDRGVRVVISTKIADIFAGNAFRNGLLTIEVSSTVHERLLAADGLEAVVDLVDGSLVVPKLDLAASFDSDPFARLCLLEGSDPLAFLLGQQEAITSYLEGSAVPSPDLKVLIAEQS